MDEHRTDSDKTISSYETLNWGVGWGGVYTFIIGIEFNKVNYFWRHLSFQFLTLYFIHSTQDTYK